MKLPKYSVSLLLLLFPVVGAQAQSESSVETANDEFDEFASSIEEPVLDGSVFYKPELTSEFMSQFHADLGKYVISHKEGNHAPVPYHQAMDPVPLNLLEDFSGESIMIKFAILSNGHVANVQAWDGISKELETYVESYVSLWLFYPRIKDGIATTIPRVSIPLKVKAAAPLLAQVEDTEDE